ncbi:MAG: CDP-diacylglycerol O-phosphatidyltransferase, partial [Stellaceae bacterium]
VSKVPTVSLKRLRVPNHLVVPTLLGIGVLAAFVTTAPWPTLTAIGIVYIGSIPLTMRAYERLRRTADGRRNAPAESAVVTPPAAGHPLDEASPPINQWRH